MRTFCLIVLIFLAATLSACGGTGAAGVAAPPGNAERGRALFLAVSIRDTPGCITCHSLEPGKVVVGPSLAGIATRSLQIIKSPDYTGDAKTSEEFLRESITMPTADLGAGFSHSVMPDWMTVLDRQEIEDLVAFLETQK